MAADVFGFYTVVAMGLFTVLSIIIGYALLNAAVVNVARGSAYYTYTRIIDAVGGAMNTATSSITNLNIYPRYVIFSAYFESEDEIYYDVIEGLRMFSYGINQNQLNMFKENYNSVTGTSYSNEGDPLREELKKCVKDQCICFGEMESRLNLSSEFLNPLACVDICWGEYPAEYGSAINSTILSTPAIRPNVLINAANTIVSTNHPSSKCGKCAQYMASDKYKVLLFQGLSAITINIDEGHTNFDNYKYLWEFSKATKFSFIPNIIECQSMSKLAEDTGKVITGAPHLFMFGNETINQGIFALLTPSSQDSVLIKILSFNYVQDYPVNRQRSYVETSFIKAEKNKDSIIFGAE